MDKYWESDMAEQSNALQYQEVLSTAIIGYDFESQSPPKKPGDTITIQAWKNIFPDNRKNIRETRTNKMYKYLLPKVGFVISLQFSTECICTGTSFDLKSSSARFSMSSILFRYYF